LETHGVKLLYQPEDQGYGISTALLDPDGNFIELVQLSDDWFKHLANRKQQGIDVVSCWQQLTKSS
jgi:hypothetical protein